MSSILHTLAPGDMKNRHTCEREWRLLSPGTQPAQSCWLEGVARPANSISSHKLFLNLSTKRWLLTDLDLKNSVDVDPWVWVWRNSSAMLVVGRTDHFQKFGNQTWWWVKLDVWSKDKMRCGCLSGHVAPHVDGVGQLVPRPVRGKALLLLNLVRSGH